jgi:enoyl-CoA hydratase/carnithine racemase
LVGRSRAIEIILGAEDYDAETAERYGWINRAIPDAELDDFVANFVRRVLPFDQQTLSTAKKTINQLGFPYPAHLQATEDIFFTTYQWPGAIERMPKLHERGIGTPGEFELDLGDQIGNL